MDQSIASGVKSGSISQTDETALETALDSIDSAMGAGSSTTTTAATQTSKLDPSQVGDRIDDLIDEQVKAGKLTQDQANTLQSLFAQNAPPQGGPNGKSGSGSDDMAMNGVSGARGGGHVHGMHHKGPPPGTDSTDGTDSDSDTDDVLSTITGTTGSSSSASSSSTSATGDTDQSKALDSLIAFLNNMRDKMNAKGTYGASGSTATASSSSATTGLVVDSFA